MDAGLFLICKFNILKSRCTFSHKNKMFDSLEQETHGPHRSPEKTVQIIKQIWLYHNVDSENKEKTLWEFIGSSFEQTWIPFTQGCFVPSLVEIGPVLPEKKILKFRKCVFSLFHNYLPLEKSGALPLIKP